MATFFNQASLSYNGQITNSNITEGEVIGALSIEKIALNTTYSEGDTVVYLVTLQNTSASALTDVSVSDDLGAFDFAGTTYVPLTYVDGSVMAYLDGVATTPPTATAGTSLVFDGITIPAGSTYTLIYQALVNGQAPLGEGATITNTATATGCAESISDSATISAVSEVNLSIAKAICPPVITECSEITYTFIIQNTGAVAVGPLDDVILTDTFNPILTGITVTSNGVVWTEGVEYTYDETTGVFTTLPGAITVDGASFIRNPVDGVITTTPGVNVITVSGRI